MKFFLFYVAFVWPITAAVSLGHGWFSGLDRPVEKEKFRKEFSTLTWKKSPRKLIVVFAFLGFLFPLVYPIRGLLIGIISFFIFVLISS